MNGHSVCNFIHRKIQTSIDISRVTPVRQFFACQLRIVHLKNE